LSSNSGFLKKETMAPKKKITPKKPTHLKIKILLPVAGKFLLTFDVGKEYEVEFKQATELIEAQYAEAV